jgi:hypothetical protein
LWSRLVLAAALPDRIGRVVMSRIDFRSGSRRPGMAPPVASGRFAGLEIQERRDRERMREHSVTPKPEPIDPHNEPSERLLAAWSPVDQTIRAMVDELVWRMWLIDLHPHRLLNGTWYLATSPRKRGWVEERFGRLLAAAAGCPVQIIACECTKAACAA